MSANPIEPSYLDQLPACPDGQLQFVALGGVGEIGMNAYLYGYKGQYLLVDCGVSFSTPFTPGVEVLVPDLAVLEGLSDSLVGLVITHGHEDHLGAVGYLYDELDCPVYASPFTAALLEDKLSEQGLDPHDIIRKVKPGKRFKAGKFELELVRMTHSIPEPCALVIHSPNGALFHTGDWKLDGEAEPGRDMDVARLKSLGDEGVFALVGDSTNVLTESAAGTEASARKGLERVIAAQKGRVVVACFATNLARVLSVIQIAEKTGRHIALAGRSMRRIIRVAKETGYLKPSFEVVLEESIDLIPRENLLLLSTGSQGESRAALTRIASDGNRHIKLEEGDTVIYSSRMIPGNELDISKVQNKLADKGVQIITDDQEPDIHVSGHPGRKELRELYSWLRPSCLIPVHGEARHLMAHAELGKSMQMRVELVKNGEILALSLDGNSRQGTVETSKLAIDGDRFVDIYGEMMRERRKIMQTGFVHVVLPVDKGLKLAGEPIITCVGVLELPEEQDVLNDVQVATSRLFGKLSKADRRDPEAICEAMRVKVRREFRELIGTKPTVYASLIGV